MWNSLRVCVTRQTWMSSYPYPTKEGVHVHNNTHNNRTPYSTCLGWKNVPGCESYRSQTRNCQQVLFVCAQLYGGQTEVGIEMRTSQAVRAAAYAASKFSWLAVLAAVYLRVCSCHHHYLVFSLSLGAHDHDVDLYLEGKGQGRGLELGLRSRVRVRVEG